MSKFKELIKRYKYLLIGIFGAFLISLTLKTQTVILVYGDMSVKLDYTLYGFCIRASATIKEAEPILENEIYLASSINNSVLKAVRQFVLLNDQAEVFKVQAFGYPRSNAELESDLIDFLAQNGFEAQALSTQNSG